MTTADWLTKLHVGPRAEQLAPGPFHAAVDDAYWTVATDGRALIALAGLVDGFEPNARGAGRVQYYLHSVTEWAETLPWDVLRRWCEPAVYEVPCPRCKGASCDYCDGEGSVLPDPAPGRVLGTILDRRLLACFIDQLPAPADGLVRVAIYPAPAFTWKRQPLYPDPADRPLIFEPITEGQAPWRVAVMPLNEQSALIREQGAGPLFGADLVRPEWLAWNGGTVPKMAQVIGTEQRWGDLPILADALCEADADQNGVLVQHLRADVEHGAACWVADLLRMP